MEEKRLKTLDEWFEEVSVEIDNAEFVECTGTYNGKKVVCIGVPDTCLARFFAQTEDGLYESIALFDFDIEQ